MKEILQQDLYRYIGAENKNITSRLRYILFTPGFQYIYCFRHAALARNPLSKLFWKVLLRRCMFHSGIQIPVGTRIGAGFRISHFGSIVINPAAKIGKNFSIAQGALIGSADGKRKGVPRHRRQRYNECKLGCNWRCDDWRLCNDCSRGFRKFRCATPFYSNREPWTYNTLRPSYRQV